MSVSQRGSYYTCPFAKVSLPLCVTLVTESSEQKVRHAATASALCETGGEFTSRQHVKPGEAIGIILHPDIRYAVRGRIVWTRLAEDRAHTEFGVAFEENIPHSLWTSLTQLRAA